MNCLRLARSFLRPNIFKIASINYTTNNPVKFRETEERWRAKDNVSRRWELIYKAPMGNFMKFLSTYLTITTGTIASGGLYYAAFVFDKSEINNPIVFGEDVVIANSGIECLVYLGAFFAFHGALKILLSKYVLRLYQDGDNYLAVFQGHMYNSITKHEFHLEDFQKLNPTFVVSWGDARYSLGNKHAIILENYFKTPEYFNNLLNKKTMEKSDVEE